MTDHSTRRSELLESIKDFMIGKTELEVEDERGATVKIQHDAGYFTAAVTGEELTFLELLSVPRLEILSAKAEKERAAGRLAVMDIKDVKDVTGIALGDGRVNSPGFPNAKLIGEARPGESAEDLLARVAAEDNERYLDPALNPMIRLDPDAPTTESPEPDEAEPKKEAGDVDRYLDPALNPMIRLGDD